LLTNLAGIKAVQLVFGCTNSTGFAQDEKRSWAMVNQLTTEKPTRPNLSMSRASDAAKRILKPHVDILLAITNRLLQDGSVDSDEFLAIRKDWDQGQPKLQLPFQA
jgi:hypothetical protein